MRWMFLAMLGAAACGGSGAKLPACDDANPAPGSVCAPTVSGLVVDEAGAPVTPLVVSVCADQCFFGATTGDGTFTVVPDLHILLDNYAFELHGRPDRVTYYTPLPTVDKPSAHPHLTFAAPLVLPKLPDSGPEIHNDGTAQTVTAGDVTLTIASATTILFSVEDFGAANGHQLRTLRATSTTGLPFVGATAPSALYALSPFEASFSQPVAVHLVNHRLPAGAAVELLQMTGLVNDAPPAGHFVHAANAHVSADGATIDTDANEGILELTWIAVQPKAGS